ncbi:2-hydroxyacid dehydrogenase [Acidimangrovimonas sediminis]|uniref:2-hydroxyacid dehydrogenase n=1 Tax=Acidimangrovimonas sediminis TaxID=2056283 RepID=UPI000C8103CA|nr:D-glycerate dehydrogenase [Acidimangrovimonas sediminis]
MKLLITRPLPEANVAAARALFDVTLREETTPLSRDEIHAALTDYDCVLPTLGDIFDAAAFAAVPAPRAKLLANFGMGYNHIDIETAKTAGVAVTNTPGAVTDATADIAMTLILMSARRAAEGERLVRSGAWQGWHPTQMLGLHVSGKVLGVVGMGRIGKAIARRAHHGFGMEVVFFNRSRVADPGVPARQLDSLAEVMATADIVVVAVPGGAGTRHLLDAAALAAMPPHAHLVNIARGDVVDEAALIAALTERRIGGAGLDVYEKEPQVPEALRALDNVTLLPHLGTAALETRAAMGEVALDNLRAFVEGKPLPNAV